MAMRCFGRGRGLAAGSARALSFLRAVDLAAVLLAVLRAADFFNAAVFAAVRDFGFFLAIDVSLSVRCGKVSTNRDSWGGLSGSEPTIQRRTEPVDQCSRNTPSTARNSAGLISLE